MSTRLYGEDLLRDKFIDNPKTSVNDYLLGYVNSNPNVGVLESSKVIVRRNYTENDIVQIVSGGASGHEPAYAGYVGKGMLTAAIQGEVFSSPTVTEIVQTLKEISFKLLAGVLIIIPNSTSDRLNFGLAAERARSQGIIVKTIVVAEECFIINAQHGRRGLTGAILLNKIAGAMAENLFSLEEIYHFCTKTKSHMASILLSLKNCNSPSAETCICTHQMEPNEMEIGSGLHGESGVGMEKTSVVEASKLLISELSKSFAAPSTLPVVVLINNLGTVLQLEELIFVKEIINHLQTLEMSIARVYHGQFLTALDMKGFTVTLLRVHDLKILEYLDYPCEVPAWGFKNLTDILPIINEPLHSRVSKRKRVVPVGPHLSEKNANIVYLAVQFACDALISCERQINLIDSESGGGNVGTKMKHGAQRIMLDIKEKKISFNQPRIFFEALSAIAEKVIGSTIGFIYSIMFESAANTFQRLPENHEINIVTWLTCLVEANTTVKSYVCTDFCMGTMYDPLCACAEGIEESLRKQGRDLEAFMLGVDAAENIAISTKLSTKRYPDPGAHVVGIWLRALLEGIKMRYTN